MVCHPRNEKWTRVEGVRRRLGLEMLVVEEELLVLARSVGGRVIFPFFSLKDGYIHNFTSECSDEDFG